MTSIQLTAKASLHRGRFNDVMRTKRAYAASFGTGGALVLCAALLFVLASAIVAFNGLPGDGAGLAPTSVSPIASRTPAGTPAATRLAAFAATARPARRAGVAPGRVVVVRHGGGAGGGGAGGPALGGGGAIASGSGPNSPVGAVPGGDVVGAVCCSTGSVVGKVTGTLAQTVQKVASTTGSTIAGVGQAVGSTVTKGTGAVSGTASPVSPVAGRVVGGVGGAVGQTVGGAGQTTGGAVGGAGSVAGGAVGGLGQTLGGLGH